MRNLFHSAAIKLTAWYLLIIMVLSIGTSFALYAVSSNELEQNASRQVGYFEGLLGPRDLGVYSGLRNHLISEDKDHLRNNLLAFNILVLLGGGAISYGLARRTLRPIEEAMEAQQRFTADASHELRTPLTAMQSENEVSLRNKSLTKDQAIEQIKSNLEEVEKLKALSEGLLALANTEKDNEFYQAVSTEDVINGAIERVNKAADAKKITLKKSIIADLSVKGSRQNLIDLLVVLLDNAIKYSPPGKSVSIKTNKKDKQALVAVTDHGIGIKPEDLPHIFERFYRAENSRHKNEAGGYGLGLAIAQKIAETHNAYISVKSAPGKGSTFTVYLPLA